MVFEKWNAMSRMRRRRILVGDRFFCDLERLGWVGLGGSELGLERVGCWAGAVQGIYPGFVDGRGEWERE